jgi:hypothetical protein
VLQSFCSPVYKRGEGLVYFYSILVLFLLDFVSFLFLFCVYSLIISVITWLAELDSSSSERHYPVNYK